MDSNTINCESNRSVKVLNNFDKLNVSNDSLVNIRILHFNDCYNVESRETEPKGGAARFKFALDQFRNQDTLVLFSGDIIAPSIMSTMTKGMHMVPVLNECKVDCAVLGNHEFDFGIDNLEEFIKETKLVWLMSNVTDIETNQTLGNVGVYHIINKNNIRFGIIGLVEEEWLVTLATISREDVYFVDYVTEGKKLAKYLKEKEHVDYVIALTHMRFPNDCRLAENVDEIDLILGGHDHDYEIKKVNNKYIIKSGTDFREFSVIDLKFNNKTQTNLDIRKVGVNSVDFEEDDVLKSLLNEYINLINLKLENVLGEFACDLDGRFSHIRTEETNLGNFVSDIMLAATHSDCAILNSGTLRSDRLHKKGPFKLKDLFQILPMLDSIIVLNVTGKQIWQALENGVCQYPKFEGRFPQVSGMRFAFDPSKPPGKRIDPRFIKIGDEYLDLNQEYKLVTKAYLYQGKDGYNVFKNCKVLISEDECPELTTTIQNHFEAINKILSGNALSHTHHRQSLVCLSGRHSLIKSQEIIPIADQNMNISCIRDLNVNQLNSPKFYQKKDYNSARSFQRKFSIDKVEFEQCKLEPKVEGRIIKILNDKIYNELEHERLEYFESLAKVDKIPEE